jgi:Na+-driven multidrug efflux pump
MMIATTSVFAVGIGISTMLFTNPQAVAGLFIRDGEWETIKLTTHFISRIWPVFIVNGVNIVLAAYLMAMRRCFDSTMIILARNLLLPVAFLFIIQALLGKDAILVVLPLSELVTFFISIFLLYKHSPKNLLKRAPVPAVGTA